MHRAIIDIPELRGLDGTESLIRIPAEIDVPITPRVREILDTADFRRLARISQLGLVSLVYPAALHTRFEHSLGVYRLALLYLRQLHRDARFNSLVTAEDAERFIASALLHDVGHWPFCHALEDIHLPDLPPHEVFAQEFIHGGEIGEILRRSWNIDPAEITPLLAGSAAGAANRILDSLLSGPIDVDKMDYLCRDSLHAGVPYGRNFDQSRLIGSLCLNEAGNQLAITQKGRTAAEMMVFSRYVMFSEVYWHHAVRSATAMLQRAFFELYGSLDLSRLFRMDEPSMIQALLHAAAGSSAAELLDGLFGPRRRLYKRFAQFSMFQQPDIYRRLAGRPYGSLVQLTHCIAERLSQACDCLIAPHQVLLDAPPVEREVEIDIDVYYPKEACFRPLSEVSPVVQALATRQFDDYVKRVRVFLCSSIADTVTDRLGDPAAVMDRVTRDGWPGSQDPPC
jgi:HD superfamily phosphohydrolase